MEYWSQLDFEIQYIFRYTNELAGIITHSSPKSCKNWRYAARSWASSICSWYWIFTCSSALNCGRVENPYPISRASAVCSSMQNLPIVVLQRIIDLYTKYVSCATSECYYLLSIFIQLRTCPGFFGFGSFTYLTNRECICNSLNVLAPIKKTSPLNLLINVSDLLLTWISFQSLWSNKLVFIIK